MELSDFTYISRIKRLEKIYKDGQDILDDCQETWDYLIETETGNCVKLNIIADILVSPRNLDKSGIFPHDMILVESNSSVVRYYGDRKPSIDTPVQIRIYQNAPEINYMIHGHYYIYGAPFTKSFYPCGDLREYDEIAEIIAKTYDNYVMGAINLRNHGFLLYSSTIDQMEQLFEKSIFVERRIGKEQIFLSEIAFR